MAAIDKICEYSGESPSPTGLMYKYKLNNIQVLPEHRPHFKNQDYQLYFFKSERDNFYKNGHSGWFLFWSFLLVVKSVPGQVQGRYYNDFFDRRAVIRNLKKLLGVRRLDFEKINQTYHDYFLQGK